MFKAAGSTPICIITAAALRESLQQNLEVVTRKEKKRPEIIEKYSGNCRLGEGSFQSQYCDVHIKRRMMCLQMHRCDNSQHLHPLSQNQHLSQRERVLNKLPAGQHRRGSLRPSAAAARWKDAGFPRFHTSGKKSQTVLSSIASFNLWINKPTNPINWWKIKGDDDVCELKHRVDLLYIMDFCLYFAFSGLQTTQSTSQHFATWVKLRWIMRWFD